MKACLVCKTSIIGKCSVAPSRKYCSRKCARTQTRRQYQKLNPPDKNSLSSSAVGTIHELVAIIDLMRKGYEVYKSINPAANCDLAVLKDSKLTRIEVTTGYKTSTGKLIYPSKSKLRFDVLAIICRDGEITYLPELL